MKWTTEQVEEMLKYLREGKSYIEISVLINRTERSVRSKANIFGEKSSLYKESINEKECVECKTIFEDYKKNNRRFCSRSCIATFNIKKKENRKKEVKNCLYCNNLLKNKNNKYCSNKCQGLKTSKTIFERIESGDTFLHETQYKKYLIERYGEKCMECDWDKVHSITGKVPIQMEHIDGNSTNNSLDNLKLLCPNCHSLTLTYGALNKGYGRKNRKR